MSIRYPQEIIDQQANVKKELEKLARMRIDYLKSTGQMPPSASKSKPAHGDAGHVASAAKPSQPEVASSL